MWWKILIGFFVLRSVSQPAPAPVLRNPDIGTFNVNPPITSPMMQPPSFQMRTPITSPLMQADSLTLNAPIVSPMFNEAGAQKIMQPSPAFGGSEGFQF